MTFEDRDPFRMNGFAEGKIKWKSQVYKRYTITDNIFFDYFEFQEAKNFVFQENAKGIQKHYNNIVLKYSGQF